MRRSGRDRFPRSSLLGIGRSGCGTWVASNSLLVRRASLAAGRPWCTLGDKVDWGWFDFGAAMDVEMLEGGKKVKAVARGGPGEGDAWL